MTPGDILREAREGAGLSVTEMADRIDYDRSNVWRAEQNKIPVSPELLHGYEEVIGKKLDIVPTGRSRKNSPGEHDFAMTITDLTLARWCRECGRTEVSTRHYMAEPFGPWQEIAEHS